MAAQDNDEGRAYRRAMGQFATGVCLLSTATPAGPRAITVNSVTSASLRPPVLSVCIRRESAMTGLITTAGAFGISVLAATHEGISRQYAGRAERGEDTLARWKWRDGVPCVDGALAVFASTVIQMAEIGDHVVLFGTVTAFDLSSTREDALVFYAGSYARLAAMPI